MQSETDWYDNYKLKILRHNLFPASYKDPETQKFGMNTERMTDFSERIEDFVVHGEATDPSGYTPFLDFTGPMMFYPHHCAEVRDGDEVTIFPSPRVAYIK
jgi:hypothetical protein